MKRIRIVLAEDQGMLRGAFAALLSLEDDLDVVASFADGEAALSAIGALRPDVVVTDIEMPSLGGLDLAARLRATHPTIRVVILTTFSRPGYLRRAFDVGVAGYLLKERPSEGLADAIRRVARGERVVDPDLANELWNAERDPLNERERSILRGVDDGASTAELARTLGLSEGTVRNYLSTAIAKLGVATRFEAAKTARANGWL